MVSMREVEAQLRRAGCNINFQFWGGAEVRELCNVLMEGEQIKECLNGHYEGGFALLCATDQRILLIDRKPMFLTMEDIRYDMIAEIHFSHRLLNATARIFTPTKSLAFTSWNRTHLRKLVMDAQQHVMAIRQYQQQANIVAQQQVQTPAVEPAPQELASASPAAMTPLTMPQPLQQQAVQTQPEPQATPVSMTPILEIGVDAAAPRQQGPFGTVMNPFLRTPLITRNRGEWHR